MSAPPPRLLEIRGLGWSAGRREVLRGLDLDLEAGARLTVAGRSGAGKTSLLRLVAGLEVPRAGEIRLAGVPASRSGRVLLAPWRRGVQMVFQDLGLWPGRTVLANVRDALRAAGRGRREATARAREVLERLGLGACLRRRPATLSGGEARRLALARALALEPRLLLLDEPFASLDPLARAEGLTFLEEVLARTRAAVLLVTHEPEEARALGGGVAVLRDGRLDPPRPAEELCADAETFRRALAG